MPTWLSSEAELWISNGLSYSAYSVIGFETTGSPEGSFRRPVIKRMASLKGVSAGQPGSTIVVGVEMDIEVTSVISL